jgi:uncharacterized repeat protein (TIGR01451 family)
VTAQVPLTDRLSLPNRVEIDCKETDPVSDVITTVVASPNLTITKTANTDYVGPGDTLVYTITYGNTGTGHATDVRITDILPVGVKYRSASPTPTDLFTTANALTLVWKFNELHPGDYGFIVITAVTPSMSEPALTNVARMDCDQTDPVSDTVTIRVPMIFFPLIVRDFKPFCNGGFETGDFTCWAYGGKLDHIVQRAPVYEGSHAAELGSGRYACRNGVPVGSAWISQAFTVPPCYDPSRPKPTLSFKYAIFSQDILRGDRWDSFDVYISDTLILRDGNDKWEEARCDTVWNSGWRSHSEDLSAYKGQNIEVTFRNVSRVDGWFNTWTYVDNVQVTCKGP